MATLTGCRNGWPHLLFSFINVARVIWSISFNLNVPTNPTLILINLSTFFFAVRCLSKCHYFIFNCSMNGAFLVYSLTFPSFSALLSFSFLSLLFVTLLHSCIPLDRRIMTLIFFDNVYQFGLLMWEAEERRLITRHFSVLMQAKIAVKVNIFSLVESTLLFELRFEKLCMSFVNLIYTNSFFNY